MSCDCEKLKTLLAKAASEIDGAWSGLDQEFRLSTDAPNADRMALVAEIEAAIPYRFSTRS